MAYSTGKTGKKMRKKCRTKKEKGRRKEYDGKGKEGRERDLRVQW